MTEVARGGIVSGRWQEDRQIGGQKDPDLASTHVDLASLIDVAGRPRVRLNQEGRPCAAGSHIRETPCCLRTCSTSPNTRSSTKACTHGWVRTQRTGMASAWAGTAK